VREHLDSQLTQRTLIHRAEHLGWHPERIDVFDGDLGQSAAVLCQEGLPLRHERFAVGPARDHNRLLGALYWD
jgi:hypothetical protein